MIGRLVFGLVSGCGRLVNLFVVGGIVFSIVRFGVGFLTSGIIFTVFVSIIIIRNMTFVDFILSLCIGSSRFRI